jgi:hypothetical protein
MYARICLSKSASNTTDLHTIKHVLRHHSLDINQPVHMFSLLPSKTMSEELCLMAVACAITIVKQKYWKNKNRRKKWCKDYLLKREQFSHGNLLEELRFAPVHHLKSGTSIAMCKRYDVLP